MVVPPADHLRALVEREIRAVYWDRFKARAGPFPETLVAGVTSSGAVECAAGIRYPGERFFSECYLECPAETVLEHRLGRHGRRSRIIEICNLVTVARGRSLAFIRKIIDLADLAVADWAIFTATKPLRALLERNGLALTELAPAQRKRVNNPSEWGRIDRPSQRRASVIASGTRKRKSSGRGDGREPRAPCRRGEPRPRAASLV
jgi:hypothetical protein